MKKHNMLASKTSSFNGCPYHYQVNNWLYLSSWTKIPGGVLPYICLISIDRLLLLGAFLWDDPDGDQWSEITRIMADQMIRWICVQSGLIGSFDLPWSEWSWITDPHPDHLKGAHPLIWNKILSQDLESRTTHPTTTSQGYAPGQEPMNPDWSVNNW